MTKFLSKLNIVHCGEAIYSESLREVLNELGNEVIPYGTPGHPELVERAQKEKIDVLIGHSPAYHFTDFDGNNPWGRFLQTQKQFNPNILVIATSFDSIHSEREKCNIGQLTEANIRHIDAGSSPKHIARQVVTHIIEAALLEGQDLADAKAYVGNSRQQQSGEKLRAHAR